MKILLSMGCLVCGFALGFILNSLLVFGEITWPNKVSEPTRGDNNIVSLPSKPTSDQSEPGSEESIRLSSSGSSLLEPAGQHSPVTSSAEFSSSQQDNSGYVANPEFNYEYLAQYTAESSISDQQRLLAIIASADLDSILETYADIPGDNNYIHEQQWVIGLLAQRRVELDPQGVLLEIENSLWNPENRYSDNMAMYLLTKQYARQHPQDIMNWLDNLPEDSVDIDGLMTVYSSLAEVAPESALEIMMRSSNMASSRYGGPESVLHMWADKDPAAALSWLHRQDDERLINDNAESIISMLLYRDPKAARAAALEFPGLVPDSMFVIQEAGTLAATDPMGAFALAQSITDREQSISAKQSVLYTWSMDDPIAAMEFIDSLPEDNERAMYASMVAGSIGVGATRSVQKRNEVLAWSETLSPELKMQILEPLVMQWAEQDPQEVIQWWNNQPQSSVKSGLLQSIAWNIPAQQAIELYPSADESTQAALSSTIIRHLYEDEPAAARNWYEQLPNNTVKQQSLFELFMMTSQNDPQQALYLMDDTLANGVASSGERVEMVARLLPFLAYQHGDLAENWLQSADLDDYEKRQLSDMITSVRNQMNSFPMPVPFGVYPPMMTDDSLYQREFISD